MDHGEEEKCRSLPADGTFASLVLSGAVVSTTGPGDGDAGGGTVFSAELPKDFGGGDHLRRDDPEGSGAVDGGARLATATTRRGSGGRGSVRDEVPTGTRADAEPHDASRPGLVGHPEHLGADQGVAARAHVHGTSTAFDKDARLKEVDAPVHFYIDEDEPMTEDEGKGSARVTKVKAMFLPGLEGEVDESSLAEVVTSR